MNPRNVLLGVIGAIVLIILLTGGWFLSTYNGFVAAEEGVDASWAQVESQYQRRADLIPNLVSTVKGYAAHEEEVLTEITAARSQWGAAATQQSKMEAAGSMDSAISKECATMNRSGHTIQRLNECLPGLWQICLDLMRSCTLKLRKGQKMYQRWSFSL